MQPQSFLKTLKIIHLALCGGLLLFATISFLQFDSTLIADSESNLMLYLVPAVAIAGYFGSTYLFEKHIRKIKKDDSLVKKLQRYQSALVLQYAIIEGPAILALMAYYTSGNALFLAIAACMIVFLYSKKPSFQKLSAALPLSFEDQKQFDNLKH